MNKSKGSVCISYELAEVIVTYTFICTHIGYENSSAVQVSLMNITLRAEPEVWASDHITHTHFTALTG